MPRRAVLSLVIVATAVRVAVAQGGPPATPGQGAPDAFRFRGGVELINVTATVIDRQGRFVPGLRQQDFIVYDNDGPQTISHFSSERVPVSLGIAIDTSGSMAGEKMSSARGAIDRLMDILLDREDDEMFLYRFANSAQLLQHWTSDRDLLSRALARLYPGGGTAIYDAIADAVPVAQSGRNTKRALVVISDGNDTGSRATASEVRRIIRESDVLVYAIGIDGEARDLFVPRGRAPGLPLIPVPPPPFQIPGRRLPPRFPQIIGGGGGQGGVWSRGNERVNAGALRNITDDSGGRTEIVKDLSDLAGATTRIADELSKQYYLGYASPGKKDGRWHTIRVEVRDHNLRVRARKGYVAS